MSDDTRWVEDAYCLPRGLFGAHTQWAPATVDIWTDRVSVLIVAPEDKTRDLPYEALAYDCGWTLEFENGGTSPLTSGRGDDGEGTVRCYLLFDRIGDDMPAIVRGRVAGVELSADIRRPVARG